MKQVYTVLHCNFNPTGMLVQKPVTRALTNADIQFPLSCRINQAKNMSADLVKR